MKVLISLLIGLFLFASDVVILDDIFTPKKEELNIAVVVNKKKFSKYLPNLLNSINAYLIYKDIEYNLSVYSTDDNLSKIAKNFDNVIYVDTQDTNFSFYYPVIRKGENGYFGGIDFYGQVQKIAKYLSTPAISITEYKELSMELLDFEQNQSLIKRNFFYPNINYKKLKNNYILLNTSASNSVQILSKLSFKEIPTKLVFSTQINYSPYLISLTQPRDRKKLIIINSIVHLPLVLKDYNRILNTDIEFNWLNYTSSVLLNKIVSNYLDEDEYYLADFDLYIIGNRVEYPIKAYQIRNRNFTPIE